MKKFLLFFLFVFLSFQFVSAVEFSMNENVSQGETIIIKLSGNFLTALTKDNILFYKDHSRVSMEYGVAKINNNYYIYALSGGKSSGNYSVLIHDVSYMQGSSVSGEDLTKYFLITNETADFSVKPGFAVSSGNFYLTVQNLQDRDVSVDIQTETANSSEREIYISDSGETSKESSITLSSGEIRKINFEAKEGGITVQNIKLSSSNLTYNIPVYIYSALNSSESSESVKEAALDVKPSESILSLATNSLFSKIFYIYNTGDIKAENISISLSDEISHFVNLSQNHIDKLEADSNTSIILSFFSGKEQEVEGTLKVSMNSGEIAYSDISLIFLDNYTSSEDVDSSVKNCSELEGSICDSSTEDCTGETIKARDALCCVGDCVKRESGSSGSKIAIAIILLIIIALGLFLFYKLKFKKAKKSVDLLKIAKGRDSFRQ